MLAEEIERYDPGDPKTRRLYAQSLIDTGAATLALHLLDATLATLPPENEEYAEVIGLKGRASKQIFMDAADTTTDAACAAIREAVAAYRVPFEQSPNNYWHGINLSAVLHAARKRGVTEFPHLDSQAIARQVLRNLNVIAPESRDAWWNATLAEAHISLGEWEEAERALHRYVSDKRLTPFNRASTLRQLREVWEVQNEGAKGAGLIQILEARLVEQPDSVLEVLPSHVRAMQHADEPTPGQVERVLGDTDAVSIQWYRTGLDRMSSVAAVRLPFGKRFGTAFAVRAGDFGLEPGDEVLALTNHHVTNRRGVDDAEPARKVELWFEASELDYDNPFRVADVVAESPLDDGLDYALLRLDRQPQSVRPLPIVRDLPEREGRVYVIGHPGSAELHISLQDNFLLDHEGEPDGNPPDRARVRVHYHAPTKKGSSGSPVFDGFWNVIALHHAGEKHDPKNSLFGLRKLNGKSGRHSANEGIWIGSIQDHAVRLGRTPQAPTEDEDG